MIVSDKGGGDFQPPPAGTHVARCVQIVDVGTQHWAYQGKPKTTHKVRLTFELPEELHVFDEEKGEEPYYVSQDYTASLNEKSNLRKVLESWRGKPFSDEELKGFDLSKVLGHAAMVTVVHVEKNGKTYANLTGVAKMPKNMKAPKQITESLNFSLDAFSQKDFAKLPEWLQNKIKESDEYKALNPEEGSQERSSGNGGAQGEPEDF